MSEEPAPVAAPQLQPAAVPIPVLARLDPRVEARVVVTKIDMGLWDLTMLMVKLAIAAIPAGMILGFAYLMLTAVSCGLLAGGGKP